MEVRLRRVDVVQFALVTAVVYALFGFVEGLLMWGVMASVPTHGTQAMPFAGVLLMGPLMLVIFPICFFIFSFIFGLIAAALYNLVAMWTGGIGLTFDQTPVRTPVVPQT
jgi:hypothetical protein